MINKAFQEAIGEPGKPGNAEYIIYVAEKLIDVYKSIHMWSLEFKNIVVPELFQKLLDHASELSKSVIEDIEYFIEDYDKRINEAVNELEENSKKKNLKFTLTLRSPDMSKIDSEIHRLSSILLTEVNQSGLS